jgi:hypothetical protein
MCFAACSLFTTAALVVRLQPGRACFITATPLRAVVFHRKPTGEEYPAWEAAGCFTIVPLGKTLANGGKAAERAVLERVLDALTQMRKDPENAPAPAQASFASCCA